MKLLQKLGQPISQEIMSSALEGRVDLRLRFRNDSTTVTLDHSQEIGVLDCRMAAALQELKEIAPMVIFELSVHHEEDRDSCARQGITPASVHSLQIAVYGPDEYYHTVGSIFSSAGMYLQEPVRLDDTVLYRNPHFLSWDDDSKTPLLGKAGMTSNTDLEIKIEAILECPTDSILSPFDVKQDPRISTTLRRYDFRYENPPIESEH